MLLEWVKQNCSQLPTQQSEHYKWFSHTHITTQKLKIHEQAAWPWWHWQLFRETDPDLMQTKRLAKRCVNILSHQDIPHSDDCSASDCGGSAYICVCVCVRGYMKKACVCCVCVREKLLKWLASTEWRGSVGMITHPHGSKALILITSCVLHNPALLIHFTRLRATY